MSRQIPLIPPRSKMLLVAVVTASGITAIGGACQRGGVSETAQGPTTEELVSYYCPKAIKILPFTKARSFDDDGLPDGLGVSLRTLDAAGDPVKAYGTFIFELYEYRPAASDHRGRLIQTWTQPVLTPEDQRQFWERVTTTYEFQLSWEGEPLTAQKRYVLGVSFQSPGAPRLFDEYEYEFRVRRQEILDALGEPGS